jgi:hypothetical protein
MLTALIFLPAMLSLLGQYEPEAEPRPEAKVEPPPLRAAA